MPYVIKLVTQGIRAALEQDPGFTLGVNVAAGAVTSTPVAESLGVPCEDAAKVISATFKA